MKLVGFNCGSYSARKRAGSERGIAATFEHFAVYRPRTRRSAPSAGLEMDREGVALKPGLSGLSEMPAAKGLAPHATNGAL
jgi:hypothetical protein